eukprot:4405799-Pyramimonas_sp.AAC.1
MASDALTAPVAFFSSKGSCQTQTFILGYSLPRLRLEGFLLSWLKGPGSGNQPGWFPQYPPR